MGTEQINVFFFVQQSLSLSHVALKAMVPLFVSFPRALAVDIKKQIWRKKSGPSHVGGGADSGIAIDYTEACHETYLTRLGCYRLKHLLRRDDLFDPW